MKKESILTLFLAITVLPAQSFGAVTKASFLSGLPVTYTIDATDASTISKLPNPSPGKCPGAATTAQDSLNEPTGFSTPEIGRYCQVDAQQDWQLYWSSQYAGMPLLADVGHIGPSWVAQNYPGLDAYGVGIEAQFALARLSDLAQLTGPIRINAKAKYHYYTNTCTGTNPKNPVISIQLFCAGATDQSYDGCSSVHDGCAYMNALSSINGSQRKDLAEPPAKATMGEWLVDDVSMVGDPFDPSICQGDLVIRLSAYGMGAFQFGELDVQMLSN